MIRRAGWVLLPLVCLPIHDLSARGQALPSATALTAAAHSEPVPPDLHSSVAALLKPGGLRAVIDGITLEFWWSVSVAAGDGWSSVPEGSVVGAVRLSGAFRDIRGSMIKPGTYTLRYGVQPDNGDHLGVSPHRQFLLISPAADDRSPAALGHEATVEISKNAVGGSHPAIWSIDPPVTDAAPLTIHKTDLGHQAVVVALPSGMKFGLVLVGKIEA